MGGNSKKNVVKALQGLQVFSLTLFLSWFFSLLFRFFLAVCVRMTVELQSVTTAGRSRVVVSDSDDDDGSDDVSSPFCALSFSCCRCCRLARCSHRFFCCPCVQDSGTDDRDNKDTPKAKKSLDLSAFTAHFAAKPPTRAAARVSTDSFRAMKAVQDQVLLLLL